MPAKAPGFAAEFCDYYRIPMDFWPKISVAQSAAHYGLILTDLGVPALWKSQADEAIVRLEELTGNQFVVDSTRNQFGMDQEKMDAEREKIESGYYSAEKIAEREQALFDKYVTEEREKADKEIAKIERDYQIRMELFKVGGHRIREATLYYSHNETVGFNWRGYGEKIDQSEADQIMQSSPILADLKYTVK